MKTDPTEESWLEIIRRHVAGMKFGSISIMVHDGRVTQIETTQKTRLPSVSASQPGEFRQEF